MNVYDMASWIASSIFAIGLLRLGIKIYIDMTR